MDLHGAHLLDLPELIAEVFEREAVAAEGFFCEVLLPCRLSSSFFRAFEQGWRCRPCPMMLRDDAVGVEGLERVGLFAGAEELDGRAGDVADGECRAAARVAVHLGEHDAGDAEAAC